MIAVAALVCPRCKGPLAADHECRIDRGRRYFLLGALAAPLIARLPLVAPPPIAPAVVNHAMMFAVTFRVQAHQNRYGGWTVTVVDK